MAIKCRHFPGPGEMVEGSGFSCIPSGSGPLCAVALAHCGCESCLLSKVGHDVLGNMACERLKEKGVNIDFTYKAPAISTGTVVTFVDSHGENCSCISHGANRALSADEVSCALTEQLISSANVFLIKGRLPAETIISAMRTALLCCTKVVLSAELIIDESGQIAPIDWPIEYFEADVLIPEINYSVPKTQSSAGIVTEMKFISTELVAKGAKCVVIKMGQRGVLVTDREGPNHIPGIEYELVDKSASEEAFAAAMAASIGAGDEPVMAARFAYAAEILTSGQFGNIDALPRKDEIIELLQNQPD